MVEPTHGNGDAAGPCPMCDNGYDAWRDACQFCEGTGKKNGKRTSSAIPGRAGESKEQMIERVKLAIIHAHDTDPCWTFDDLARAAIQACGGEKP